MIPHSSEYIYIINIKYLCVLCVWCNIYYNYIHSMLIKETETGFTFFAKPGCFRLEFLIMRELNLGPHFFI